MMLSVVVTARRNGGYALQAGRQHILLSADEAAELGRTLLRLTAGHNDKAGATNVAPEPQSITGRDG